MMLPKFPSSDKPDHGTEKFRHAARASGWALLAVILFIHWCSMHIKIHVSIFCP